MVRRRTSGRTVKRNRRGDGQKGLYCEMKAVFFVGGSQAPPSPTLSPKLTERPISKDLGVYLFLF